MIGDVELLMILTTFVNPTVCDDYRVPLPLFSIRITPYLCQTSQTIT